MNTEDHLNQLLQEAQVTTSTTVDDHILEPAREALDRPRTRRLAKRFAWRVPLRIAAVVLLGILVWWALKPNLRSHSEPMAGADSASPVRAMSLHSLQQACRGGDIETLEAHLDRALTQVGPRPTALLDEVLAQSSNES